jgi:hypothetical protein
VFSVGQKKRKGRSDSRCLVARSFSSGYSVVAPEEVYSVAERSNIRGNTHLQPILSTTTDAVLAIPSIEVRPKKRAASPESRHPGHPLAKSASVARLTKDAHGGGARSGAVWVRVRWHSVSCPARAHPPGRRPGPYFPKTDARGRGPGIGAAVPFTHGNTKTVP